MPQSATVRIHLFTDPDFKITVPTRRQTVVSGGNATYRVESDGLGTYVDDTDLDVTGLPEGVDFSFAIDPIGYDASTNLTVDTTELSVGTHEFSIDAEIYTPPQDAIYADSCSLSDVQTAIAAASPGQTVIVPAGSATWDSPLVVTKPINLWGDGIGSTVITGNFSDAYNGVISYKPDSAARESDLLTRIHGFTLLCGGQNGFYLYNDTLPAVSKVRVDHNRIVNSARGIYVLGFVYGVADHNTLETFGHGMDGEGTGGGRDQWLNLGREYGTADNFYFEDNTFVINGTGVFHAGGHGGRWVARYNNYSGNTGNMSPVFDAHGNQYLGGINGIYGTMITEWYGNSVDLGSYAAGSYFDHRGGWSLFFCNDITTDYAQLWVREEFDDATFPYPNDFVMKVTNSYYWNNRQRNLTLMRTEIDSDLFQREPDIENDPPSLVENREFWNHNTSYNGTTQIGVYAGTTLPAHCAVGDAAWITTQSVSDLTGMTGVEPATPISGTLYKCLSTDVWTEYYEPYTYPHPVTLL